MAIDEEREVDVDEHARPVVISARRLRQTTPVGWFAVGAAAVLAGLLVGLLVSRADDDAATPPLTTAAQAAGEPGVGSTVVATAASVDDAASQQGASVAQVPGGPDSSAPVSAGEAPTSAPAATTSGPPMPQTFPTGIDAPDLPPLAARLADGKAYVTGVMPTQETADELIRRVGAVFGPEFLVADLKIDPRAPIASETVLRVTELVAFPTGSAQLDPGASLVVEAAALLMQKLPEVTLRIIGHTDSAGDDAANLALSQARAQAVLDALVAKGIAASRLEAVGMGETQPVADNNTLEGRAKNRRIEFMLAGLMS